MKEIRVLLLNGLHAFIQRALGLVALIDALERFSQGVLLPTDEALHTAHADRLRPVRNVTTQVRHKSHLLHAIVQAAPFVF